MNEPRRLSQGGGASQRLLDSASIDKPSAAARRRAMLAATASSFSSTQPTASTPRAPRRHSSRGRTAKTLATWMLIGAAASALIALGTAKLLDSSGARNAANQPASAMSVLPELAAPPPSAAPGIASEPPSPITPEAMALRIEALSKSGKTAEANALAAEFLRKYPAHPLAERVRAGLGK